MSDAIAKGSQGSDYREVKLLAFPSDIGRFPVSELEPTSLSDYISTSSVL